MIQWRDYLASISAVCGGQLCAKGTLVMVRNILCSLYPELRQRQVKSHASKNGRSPETA
jgi:uncharacterized protein (DUF433 family)